MKTNKHLIISGILFSIVLFLWPIFMGIAQPEGTVVEQLNWIRHNTTIFKIQFFFAFLIAPSILYIMFSQLNDYKADNSISSKIGLIFLTGYVVMDSISYASQIIIVPNYIHSGSLEQASVWYLNSTTSVTYFINQLGYCFWGIASIILFSKLILGKGMIKYLSMIYILSATLSIVAFVGLIMDNTFLNSMTFLSGLLLLPVGIMTVIWGIRENKSK